MSDDFIMLKNVRVSFPHLFKRPIINGQESKCGAQLLIDNDKQAKMIAALKKRIEALAKERLKGRVPPSDKLCLRDGEDKGRAEYEGYSVLSANSKDKPFVISNDGRSVITDQADCTIYAGCFVNAKVRLWAQDNQFGKRINCELVAIQFAGDGDAFDGTYVSADEAVSGFDATGGDDGDDDFLAA